DADFAIKAADLADGESVGGGTAHFFFSSNCERTLCPSLRILNNSDFLAGSLLSKMDLRLVMNSAHDWQCSCMAWRLAQRISVQSSGDPEATRVVSRNPPAARASDSGLAFPAS